MNRTAACIAMISVLKARGKMNTQQLAEALQTNPRNIREFKKELELAGFPVEVERGREGGYYINDDKLLPSVALTAAQQQALAQGRAIVASHPEFSAQADFQQALDKVLASGKANYVAHTYLPMRNNPIREDEKVWIRLLEEAIELQLCVTLTYQKLGQDKPETFVVEPYAVVHCNDTNYLVAFSRKSQGYRTYRISHTRMKNVEMSLESFSLDNQFTLSDYIGKDSIFKGTMQEYQVGVKPAAERQFLEVYWGAGLDQIETTDEYIIYRFYSDQMVIILRQLFSFASDVKLLAPAGIVRRYEEQLRQTLAVYGG